MAVTRVIFLFNNSGRKSGEAFVQLQEHMAAMAAQVLNHKHMGQRYVEVFVSSEEEAAMGTSAPMQHMQHMPAAVAGPTQIWPTGAMQGIVRVRGLPFNSTPEALLGLFSGYPIPNGVHGVHLVLGANGRPNGEAYVEFGSEEVADAALAKDRATLGTRYVEVFRATPEQMAKALSRTNKSNNLAAGTPMQPVGVGPPQGAMSYAYGPFSMPAPMGYPNGAPPMMAAQGMEAVVKMRGLPYKVTRNDVLDFFAGLAVPLNGVHLMFNEREQPTGEAYVEFSGPDDRERAMSKDRQHMGGRYVELFRVSRAEMLQALEQFVGGYSSTHPVQMQMPGAPLPGAPMAQFNGMYGAVPQYAQPGYMGAPNAFGPPMQHHMQVGAAGMAHGGVGKSGTLRIRGIPFRATVDDVFRFFSGFQIMPGGIVIGQRDGRPSGEAWVTFASPVEAQRAMGLNHKTMGNRYVELFAA
uniref:RRM domain-containing protein n=1 Tax=Chrysotila carterae TaxID=13221 RepID=A0A7S4B3A2_CHRCT